MDFRRYPHQRDHPPSAVGGQQARFLDSLSTPSLRHKNPDGSVSIKNNGRLKVQREDEQQDVIGLSRLCWLPSGIVITPRTATNQTGWGLPPTQDGMGTVGGDFPYVVINQYEHNNTPEYLHSVYSDKAFINAQGIQLNLNWPINYINFEIGDRKGLFGKQQKDDAGAFRKGSYLPQFIARYVPLLTEKKQAGWYCHRPKIRPWLNDELKDLHEAVNNVRLANGLPDLSPPIEGWVPDHAQATTLVNILAKEQANDSPNFTVGWQANLQRIRSRAGRFENYGENLYTGSQPGKEFALQTVNAWIDSPGHFDVMTTDYTNGAREIYTTQGQGQYIAECNTLGTWGMALFEYEPGKRRAREMAEVITSASPRTARCTTWRNPILGSMSISGTPAALSMFGTRNMVWATRSAVSYKQVDLVVAENTDIPTQREIVVGAALCVIQGQQQMTDEQFNSLLFRKRERDRQYNTKRVEQGKAVDSACVGAEDYLTPAMTGWDVQMRTLSYEEVGAQYASPSTDNTVCSIVLRGGKAEDFLATRQELRRINLPFNPASIAQSAKFSEDGQKCVYAVSELLTGAGSENGKWHGERLHFYEFTPDGVSEVATSEIDIEVSVPYGAGEYRHTAVGQCKLYPYYQGNSLEWVEMKVDSLGWYNNSTFTSTSRRVLHSSLVIDGVEWVYTDTQSGGLAGSSDTAVSGTVKHLLYFDPLFLDRAHWIEYTLTKAAANTTTGTAVVMRDMTSPTVVKTLYSGITLTGESNGDTWLVPMFTNKSQANPAGTIQYLHPARRWSTKPEANFKAAFTLGGSSLALPAGANYAFGGGRPFSTPLSPVSFSQVVGHSDNLADANISNAYAVCGGLHSQPFGFGTSGKPLGTTTYFRSSNLDLEAITGIAGLSDNILPIWGIE